MNNLLSGKIFWNLIWIYYRHNIIWVQIWLISSYWEHLIKFLINIAISDVTSMNKFEWILKRFHENKNKSNTIAHLNSNRLDLKILIRVLNLSSFRQISIIESILKLISDFVTFLWQFFLFSFWCWSSILFYFIFMIL